MITEPALIRSLAAVAEHTTVTAAAEALGFSSSAISQHLARLESQLGVPVVAPTGRNIELTRAGRALLDAAPAVFAALDAAAAAARGAASGVRGIVRIGTFQSAAVRLLPAAIGELAQRYPTIRVEVFQQPTSSSLEALDRGQLDIVLNQGFGPPITRRGHDITALMDDPLVLVTPRAEPPPRRLEDLATRTWICPRPEVSSCAPFMLDLCRSRGFEPDVRWWVEDYLLLVSLVGSGAGVGLVSGSVAANIDSPVRLTPVGPDAIRTLYAHTRPATLDPAAAALFAGLVRCGAELGRSVAAAEVSSLAPAS